MTELKTVSIHLVDGSTIIAKQKDVTATGITVLDPLILTTYKSLPESVQLILTKYDTFNYTDGVGINFFYAGIISLYEIDDTIKVFYDRFVETYANNPPEVKQVRLSDLNKEKADGPVILTEDAPKPKAKEAKPKVNIDELRKETVKIKLATKDGVEVEED